MNSLINIESELRDAVESRQYQHVERLVALYCEAARTYARTLAPESAEARETAKTVLETLQWATRMLQAGRECIALELSRLPGVQRYLQSPPAEGGSWQVEV